MDYSINALAQLSGVSTRTLRYYDSIGLLVPARVRDNGYRVYGEDEVAALQQILFYREQGMALGQIKQIMKSDSFNRLNALNEHLLALESRRDIINGLIESVKKTISCEKGEIEMSDKEKFEALKASMIKQNEEKYGAEAREKYGNEAVDGSVFRISGMTQEQWDAQEALRLRINEVLCDLMKTGDEASPLGKELFELHRDWICMMWKQGTYTGAAHKGLAQMYACDERFKAYYEAAAGEGAADLLLRVITLYA